MQGQVMQDGSVNGRSINERQRFGKRVCIFVCFQFLVRGLYTFLLDSCVHIVVLKRWLAMCIGLFKCRGQLIELSLEGVVQTPFFPIRFLNHDGIAMPA